MNAMNAMNAVHGVLAECQVIWNEKRYDFIQAIRMHAKYEKIRDDGGKVIGWKGKGVIRFHYNDSIFRRMLAQSKEMGEDIFFDMLVTNDDPVAQMGRQKVLLKGCCIECGTVAEFDAEADYLSEYACFTFEDFEFLEKFQYDERKKGGSEGA